MGGIMGAYFTGYMTPYWCFGVLTIFSLFVFMSAFLITAEMEMESDVEIE